MNPRIFLFLIFLGCNGVSLRAADVEIAAEPPECIAFGSCYRSNRNPQIWEAISTVKPQLFLFLGDNVYADTSDRSKMRAAYDALNAEKEYLEFKKDVPIIPTWDDHDYGKNDAGAEFEAKQMAKDEFMRSFEIPAQHPMRERGGVYHSVAFGPPEKRLQVIMLDTRWFRSELKEEGFGYRKKFVPNTDEGAGILGEEQWKWLEEQLKEPARLRLIGSSIQVLARQHRFEKWSNFPADLERLRRLLSGDLAGEVIMLSGDRHMGEIMKDGELKEVTSSGLTNAGGGFKNETNEHRVGNRMGRRNFGVLKIDWSKDGLPPVKAMLLGADAEVVEEVQW